MDEQDGQDKKLLNLFKHHSLSFMLLCFYAFMPLCLYAFMPLCLYPVNPVYPCSNSLKQKIGLRVRSL